MCCWESRRDVTTEPIAEAVGKCVEHDPKTPTGVTHGTQPISRRWIESGNPIALERRRSACLRFELISESLHGEDKFWLFRIFFQFLTQAGHVHVHGACVHVRAVSPHLS